MAVGSSCRQPISRTSSWICLLRTGSGRGPLKCWRATASRRACSIRTFRRMIQNYAGRRLLGQGRGGHATTIDNHPEGEQPVNQEQSAAVVMEEDRRQVACQGGE